MSGSGTKRKRAEAFKAAREASRSKRPDRRRPPRRAEAEDDASSVSSAGGDTTGFAAVFDKLMARNIPKSVTVMAKRHTASAKIADALKQEHKSDLKKRKERKEAKLIRLELPSQAKADTERDLKRLATKGVVALFNAITKHQKALTSAQDDKFGGKSEGTTTSFLELLKQASQGVAVKAKPARASSAPVASAPSKTKWSVLQDDYLQQKDEGDESGSENEVAKHRMDDVLGGSSDSD